MDGADVASAASSPRGIASSARQRRRAGLWCQVSAMCSRTTNQCQPDSVSVPSEDFSLFVFSVAQFEGFCGLERLMEELCAGVLMTVVFKGRPLVVGSPF